MYQKWERIHSTAIFLISFWLSGWFKENQPHLLLLMCCHTSRGLGFFFFDHLLLNFKKSLRPIFMDWVQLPQVWSHFKEAVYFLLLTSQKFLVRILSISEGWKAEWTLEQASGFEYGISELRIQRFDSSYKYEHLAQLHMIPS